MLIILKAFGEDVRAEHSHQGDTQEGWKERVNAGKMICRGCRKRKNNRRKTFIRTLLPFKLSWKLRKNMNEHSSN